MKRLLFVLCISFVIQLPAQWMQMSPDTTFFNNRVFFNSASKGFVVSFDGTIQQTYDGGLNWDTIQIDTCDWSACLRSPYQSNLRCVFFPDGATGYIGGQDGDLFKTTDGGLTWQCAGMLGGWDDIHEIYFFNNDTGVAATAINLIWRTTDGGQNWTYTSWSVSASMRFAAINDSTLLMSRNGIFRSQDYGMTWTRMNADTNYHYCDISMSDSLHGIASVCQGGKISITSDGGLTWSPPALVVNEWIYAVEMLNPDTGFIAGGPNIYPIVPTYGYIIQTTDGGITWSQPDTIANKTIMDLWFPNDSLGIAVGWLGNILRTTNPVNAVGLDEINNSEIRPKLFPNPASEKLNVFYPGYSTQQSISVKIIDLTGRIILDEKNLNIAPYSINVSELENGSYILILTADGKSCASPFVKQ